jgi:hypothetical protein
MPNAGDILHVTVPNDEFTEALCEEPTTDEESPLAVATVKSPEYPVKSNTSPLLCFGRKTKSYRSP